MKRLVLAAALLVLLAVSLTAAACGGNEVPAGAVATVGDGVVTQEQFDKIMDQAKAQYASQEGAPRSPKRARRVQPARRQHRQLPGPEELIAQKAEELDVTVGEKELTDASRRRS